MNEQYLIGLDVGGTQCGVSLARAKQPLRLLERRTFATQPRPEDTLAQFMSHLDLLLDDHGQPPLAAIGISCGGPLDSRKGFVLSPPNLPLWENFSIVAPFIEKYKVPVALQNDANACALAEWKYGAGQEFRSLVFLTHGTGMGAGLILNGQLYTGANDMAGEIGHVRLAPYGPFGHGKYGSFEGFCSGAGIAKLAQMHVTEAIAAGSPPDFCPSLGDVPHLNAKNVARAAEQGELLALEIYRCAGLYLGQGIAMLMDLLNPEAIILGGIFPRQESLLRPPMEETIQKEALLQTRQHCQVLASQLGENIGDYGALTVAQMAREQKK